MTKKLEMAIKSCIDCPFKYFSEIADEKLLLGWACYKNEKRSIINIIELPEWCPLPEVM